MIVLPLPLPYYKLFSLFSLFLFLCSVNAYPHSVFNGYQVDDLAATSNFTFNEEANSWSAYGLATTNKTSLCNGVPLLGGPGILSPSGYFQRTYTGLPGHDIIYFRINLYILDNWSPGDTIQLTLAGNSFTAGDISASTFNFPSDLCGDPTFKDLDSFYIMGQLNHTAPNVTLRITSGVGSSPDIASFGIRKVNLLFANKTLGGLGFFTGQEPYQENNAMNCSLADVPILSNSCACPRGTYQDPLNPASCLPCHAYCTDCFGPSASECFSCNSSIGSSFVRTECIKCNETCSDCSGPSGNECMRCVQPRWYKWDKTCNSTCNSPLANQEVLGDINVCKEPCLPGELYYWNGTCSASCPSPLTSSVNVFGSFCNRPCYGSNYLYWNRTCKSTCSYPLVASSWESVVPLCNKPCQTGEYFYPNGSCIAQCDLPLVVTLQNSVQTCVSPCASSTDFYYDFNNSCISNCSYPDIIQQEAFYNKCLYISTLGLTPEEIEQAKTAASVFVKGAAIISMTTGFVSLIGASNPATNTLAGFVKMLPYIRYIKINYPPKLQLMLDNLNSSFISFSIGFNPPQDLQNQFQIQPLPQKFQDYGYHSSFFINYFQTMTSLLILLGGIVILSILTHFTKQRPTVNVIFRGIKLVLKWNFFMMVFCTNFDGIIVPTSLELRTLELDDFTAVFSFLFCITMNLAALFVICFACYIILDIRKHKHRIAPEKESKVHVVPPDERWKEFQLFYKGSKEGKLIHQIFLIPYLIRICLFNFVIGYLFDYPLAQAILITLLSVFILAYILWQRPFISKLVFCQHSSDEILMFAINISLLVLAILDAFDAGSSETRAAFGDIIIYSNVVFSITANIYLVAYLIVGFKGACEATKSHKNGGLASWCVALLAPFEVGGMDLDVIPMKIEEENPSPSIKLSPSPHHLVKKLSIPARSNRDSEVSSSSYHDEGAESLFMLKERSSGSTPKTPFVPLTSSWVFESVTPVEIKRSPHRISTFAKNARPSVHIDFNSHQPPQQKVEKVEEEEVFSLGRTSFLCMNGSKKEDEIHEKQL